MKPGRRRATEWLVVAFAAGALAGALGSLGHLAWWLELFTHFRPQYAAWLALCGVGLLALRRPALGVAALLLSAANALPLSHYYGARPPSSPGGEPVLHAVLLNLWFRNGQHERVLRYVRETGPDLAVFLEATPPWRHALQGLEDVMPFQAHAGEVLVASRVPLAGLRAVPLPSGNATAIVFRIAADPAGLTVIGTHANWPLGARIAADRNRELGALAAMARSVDGPLLVLGDLNVTAFSPVFHYLLSRGRLADCAAGRGWHPTWPTWFPPLYVQIDHCLAGPGVFIEHLGTGPAVGSDHLPLEVSFRLTPPATGPGAPVTAAAPPRTFRR